MYFHCCLRYAVPFQNFPNCSSLFPLRKLFAHHSALYKMSNQSTTPHVLLRVITPAVYIIYIYAVLLISHFTRTQIFGWILRSAITILPAVLNTRMLLPRTSIFILLFSKNTWEAKLRADLARAPCFSQLFRRKREKIEVKKMKHVLYADLFSDRANSYSSSLFRRHPKVFDSDNRSGRNQQISEATRAVYLMFNR